MLSLEIRRLRGNLNTVSQCLKDGYKENGDLFTRSHRENRKGNGYMLLLGTFQLDTRGKYFTIRTISCWNNLPREMVNFTASDTFKTQLSRLLGHFV